MSACIIPVAPNFQDPPSTPDSPPYLSNFSPSFGSVSTVPVPDGLTFSANVSDPNLSHILEVRWAVDYPPYISGNTVDTEYITPSANGQPVSKTVDCFFVGNSMPTPDGKHRLELIVADRMLGSLNPTLDNVLDSIEDPTGFVVRTEWTFVISCPATTSPTTGSP